MFMEKFIQTEPRSSKTHDEFQDQLLVLGAKDNLIKAPNHTLIQSPGKYTLYYTSPPSLSAQQYRQVAQTQESKHWFRVLLALNTGHAWDLSRAKSQPPLSQTTMQESESTETSLFRKHNYE